MSKRIKSVCGTDLPTKKNLKSKPGSGKAVRFAGMIGKSRGLFKDAAEIDEFIQEGRDDGR